MKAVIVGILAAAGMFIFGTKPLVNSMGGSMKVWQILLVDVLVGLAFYALVA